MIGHLRHIQGHSPQPPQTTQKEEMEMPYRRPPGPVRHCRQQKSGHHSHRKPVQHFMGMPQGRIGEIRRTAYKTAQKTTPCQQTENTIRRR